MKILFVSEYYPPKIMGGGEINLSLLAQALAREKFTRKEINEGKKEEKVEVAVLTSFHSGLKRFEEEKGVKIYRWLKTGADPHGLNHNFQRSFLFPDSVVKEVKRLSKRIQPDVIHFIGTSLIAAPELCQLKIGGNKKPVPLFATIESYPSLCPKGDRIYCGRKECRKVCSLSKFLYCQSKSSEIGKMKNKWYLKYNLPFLIYVYEFYHRMNQGLLKCHLLAISKYVQGILRQQKLPSTVIPNAIDLDFFRVKKSKEEKRKLKENKLQQKIKITYFGSLTKFKGPQVILKTLEELQKEGLTNYQVDFYGEGPLKEQLAQRIQQKRLNAVLHSPVPYAEVPSLYAAADIIIFPSLWPEPFGRISIEAMAAGKPVIGVAMGGIKETIIQEGGKLVSPGNVQELKEAIKGLVNKGKLETNCQKIIQEKYSKGGVVKKLLENYRSV